jgi:hypothetical protein
MTNAIVMNDELSPSNKTNEAIAGPNKNPDTKATIQVVMNINVSENRIFIVFSFLLHLCYIENDAASVSICQHIGAIKVMTCNS